MENEMTATIHQLFGINIETEELNPTRREFEDVRKDFFNRLDQSIDAILDGREEDAPMCVRSSCFQWRQDYEPKK